MCSGELNWHKQAASQSVGVSGHQKRHYFLLPLFSFFFRDLFSLKECLDQKLIFQKLDRTLKNQAAILDFACGTAFQVVSECPQRRQAGIPNAIATSLKIDH